MNASNHPDNDRDNDRELLRLRLQGIDPRRGFDSRRIARLALPVVACAGALVWSRRRRAVDSLERLFHYLVGELYQTERVLGPHTEGTIPGEAAVFALLARADDPTIDPSAAVRLEAIAQVRAVPFSKVDRVSADGLASLHRVRQRHRVEVYGLCRDCRRRDLGPLAGES